jgi:hypothetical protein
MHTLRCLLLIALLAPAICCAQKKIPVEVSHIGEDMMGELVMGELREAIRAHKGVLAFPDGGAPTIEAYGMRITSELSRPRIKLQLTTGTAAGDASGDAAIAVAVLYDSASMPLGGAFIKGMLVTCGRDNAPGCARQILGRANGSMEWLREHWPSLWKTL